MNASGEAVAALARILPPAARRNCWWRWMTRICRWGRSGCGPKGAAAGIMDWNRWRSNWGRGSIRGCAWGSGGGKTTAGRSANYVLGQFAAAERPAVEEVLNRAGQQVECWLDAGMKQAMNHFNGAAPAPLPKGKQ